MTNGSRAELGTREADLLDHWGDCPPPETVQAVQNLLQIYTLATDHGWASRFKALFEPTATWDGSAIGYGSAQGPAEIADLVLGHFDPARPMIHLPGPAIITSQSDDEVASLCWCVAHRLSEPSRPAIHFYYADRIRRDDDRSPWRFSSRVLYAAG